MSKNTIGIQWDSAPGPVDGYEVTYEPTHEDFTPDSPTFIPDSAENTFELTGIHAHTTVSFMVRTVTDGARSDAVEWRQRTFPDRE